MSEIQLLYVTNEIPRKKGPAQQVLSFFVLVENLAFFKQVDAVWAGEDGVWHTLPATYHSTPKHNKEYWQIKTTFHSASDVALPGNIQFALRYRALGEEYWDNNHSLNYRSQANSGIQVANDYPLLNIGFDKDLGNGQKLVPITVAVDPSLYADKISIHWTTDDWEHTNISRSYLKRSRSLNRDGNPIQDGVQVWKGLLNIGHARQLQYSICCEAKGQILWDNNFGQNYSAHRR